MKEDRDFGDVRHIKDEVKPLDSPTAYPVDSIEKDLTELYRKQCDGMDVLLRLTSFEVEHLNNLIGIGMSSRKGSFLSAAKKEKRKFDDWERHLCAMDRKLWRKVREAEKLAFNEKEEVLKTEK